MRKTEWKKDRRDKEMADCFLACVNLYYSYDLSTFFVWDILYVAFLFTKYLLYFDVLHPCFFYLGQETFGLFPKAINVFTFLCTHCNHYGDKNF